MEDFATQLATYKQEIDADIAAYAAGFKKETRKHYGPTAALETDAFFDILARGGKRLRGILVLIGFQMAGGKDYKIVLPAARAIEILHAYMLIIDDIQDRSTLRRGKPAAHELLAQYHHDQNLKGDANHAGLSLALLSALVGAHSAEEILATLEVTPELRLRAIRLVNQTMITTAHGQACDIMNQLVDRPSASDIDHVLLWKTAQYTIINPLQLGMVLAGADNTMLESIVPFGEHAGKAFQISDDILGIFGNEKETGKTPGDDIREGKGTLLTRYVLEHASSEDKGFLHHCLGNPVLSSQEFSRCQTIIEICGALNFARTTAGRHIHEAIKVLDAGDVRWNPVATDSLRNLVRLLQNRAS